MIISLHKNCPKRVTTRKLDPLQANNCMPPITTTVNNGDDGRRDLSPLSMPLSTHFLIPSKFKLSISPKLPNVHSNVHRKSAPSRLVSISIPTMFNTQPRIPLPPEEQDIFETKDGFKRHLKILKSVDTCHENFKKMNRSETC